MRKTKTHNVLRRLLAFVLIVSLLPLGYAGNVMAATTGTRNVSIQVTYGQTDARNVYGMINSMRRNLSDAWYWDANNYTKTYCNNLQPLTYDYALEQVAMKRAAEIALSYSHTRPNGTNYYTAYSENGVYAGVYAENIGVNYSSASALHNAMREDNANYSGQEQRRNMLNSQFTAVGIGHVYYNGYHYWVEEFANTVTRTSYTTPNNQTTTVNNIQIAESNITSDQIVVPSSIGNYIQMSAGQTIDLSGCYENIKVSNHWPSNANCPIVQGLNMYVSNTAVAYISGTKLIANTAGSTTLTLNRPDGRIPLQIPVQVTGTNNSNNTYSYYIPNASVGTIVDQTYTGYDIRPSVSVWLNGGYLYEGRDYTLTYSNNRNIGTASVTINGIGNYYGSRTVYFRIVNHGNGNTTVSSNNLANAVISNNVGRKDKQLWTDNGEGEKIKFCQFDTGYDEAEYIADDIEREVRNGASYNDHAILYRTNAQSRLFEERFVAQNIPYKIVGGVNFYARREIKDVLAYLKTIDNGKDDLAVRRIINVPKRGIGLTTINRIQESAASRGIGFYDALLGLDLIPGVARGAAKLEGFVALIEYFKGVAETLSLSDLLQEVIDKTGYIESLEAEGKEESETRIENIDELRSKVAVYEESCLDQDEKPTLSGFLEEVALVADIDSLDEEQDYVVLMTLHSAKGLEFPHVYLAGMEDGLFPSYMTVTSDDREDMEEERRLCYVGITRAEQKLTMTSAMRRMVRGETQYNKVSRFMKEIPLELLDNGNRSSKMFEERQEIPKQTAYTQAKQTFKAKAFSAAAPKQFAVSKEKGLDYGVGDRVRHMKFGEGTVTQITEGGRDFEVTVEFDTAGVKKMFAGFARLIKL